MQAARRPGRVTGKVPSVVTNPASLRPPDKHDQLRRELPWTEGESCSLTTARVLAGQGQPGLLKGPSHTSCTLRRSPPMPGTPHHLPGNTPRATGCGWPQVETDPATPGARLCSQERNPCILEDDGPALSPAGCGHWYPCVLLWAQTLTRSSSKTTKKRLPPNVLPCPRPRVLCTERRLKPSASQPGREKGHLLSSLVFILFSVWTKDLGDEHPVGFLILGG